MVIEPKFPISKEHRNQRKAPVKQTLEDVAEEILNGILCQYEPPNRTNTTQNGKPSGILRWPKNARQSKNKRYSKQQQIKSARVRWMDEQNHDVLTTKVMEPQNINTMVSPTQAGCSVAEACMDAGIEVGCVSASAPSNHQPMSSNWNNNTTTRMMNAKEAIATARAKSPRNARDDTDDIVFDDDGNPTYNDAAKKSKQKKPEIALPDVPPPPNKKERFFPELCGVRINCGDEEAYVQVIPKYNFENSVNNALDRCSKNMTDDDELIMMMDELDNSVLEDNDESDSFVSDVETLRKSMNQVRDRAREQQETTLPTKKLSRATKLKETKRTSMRDVIDHYMVKEDSDNDEQDDNDGADWEEKMSPTESSANLLRRVWPRHQSKENSLPVKSDDNSDDGIITKTSAVNRRTTLRSRSPSRLRRGESTISKPLIVQDVYESVELVNNDKEKKTIKTGISAVLKSIAAKSPRSIKKGITSSSSSLNETPTSDWDESVPIMHNLSNSAKNTDANSENPIPSTSLPVQMPYPNSDQAFNTLIPGQLPFPNSSQSINTVPAILNSYTNTYQQQTLYQNVNGVSVPSNQYPNTYPQQTMVHSQQEFIPPSDSVYPQIHPAHPLVNNGTGMRHDQDDMTERQSYITAHRLGFDPLSNKSSSTINDDMLERQSFIGAYRQGTDGVGNLQPSAGLSSIPEATAASNEALRRSDASTTIPLSYQPRVPMTRDDMMERQSFITAYRQGLDPELRPPPASLSHDDIMERMSYITASRQVLDPSMINHNGGGVPSPPKQSKRGRRMARSKSPSHNIQSVESQNSFSQRNTAMHNGIFYDNMGNPIYGHPGVPIYYNPLMMTTQPDPPINNATMGMSSAHNLYPVGEHQNASFHPAQNYNHPIYMSNNTPSVNHVAPVYQYLGNQVAGQSMGPTNDNPSITEQIAEIDENKLTPVNEEQNNETDLTWEERTRQAWERIRGGISALTFETTTEEKKDDDEGTPEDEDEEEEYVLCPGLPNQINSSINVQPSVPPLNPSYTLAQPHDFVKRVSFGEPQQYIYYDDQDENRSTMSLPGKSNKKKKQFRGAKLVGGVLGKVKHSLNKVTFSRSTSSDTVGSLPTGRSNYSTEWDGSVIHPNHSMSSVSLPYQPGPRLQPYMHPMSYGNQIPVASHNVQHGQQNQYTNIDQRHLQPVPQNTSYQPVVSQQQQQQPVIDNTAHLNQVLYQQQQAQQYSNQGPPYGYTPPHTGNSNHNSTMYNNNITAPHHHHQQQYSQIPVGTQYPNDRRSL